MGLTREMIDSQIETIRKHLSSQYVGVFNEQQIEQHIHDYIGTQIADQQVDEVLAGGKVQHLLDIGCGYGSFVLEARNRGIDAIGIDMAPLEVEFARARLRLERSLDDPDQVYIKGSGLELPFQSEQFDVVTLWNVLEHIPDERHLIQEVSRVLRNRGRVYIVCPNYAAFRTEAHYHLFWPSLLPRKAASIYLRLRGRNPAFFESSIFYRTNWGVLRILFENGFHPCNMSLPKLLNTNLIKNLNISGLVCLLKRMNLTIFMQLFLQMMLYNPFKQSIVLFARKQR